MAEFLSPAWLQELDDVARASPNLADLARETSIVVEQRVSGTPHGDVAYHFLIDEQGARVVVGHAADPDLVLTADFPTACALIRGDSNAQQAIASGGLKIGGNVSRLPRRSDAFGVLTDVFAGVRATTTGAAPDDAAHREHRHTIDEHGVRVSVISEDAFRSEARAFLDANAERRVDEKFAWGEGSDSVGVIEEKSPEEEAAEVAAAKQWKGQEFDAGYGWITGPEEYGGRALPAAYERTYRALCGGYSLPSQTVFTIGLGMVAPTILAHAIPEVKEQYLRPLYRGDVVACQLFSEPIAGSDLAGIQTRAVRDGDEWVVSGQKVWTSGAEHSDIGEIITRTSPDKPKHKGLTMFVVDMKAPGVDVRPLRQMTGGASFNEVFFEEVRIPDTHRLGDVDEGWGVALTTLMNERAAIGGGSGGFGDHSFTRYKEMARHFGVADDPVIRQRLAQIYISTYVARLTGMRSMAKVRAGQAPGPEMSIGKLSLTKNLQLMAQTVGEILGPRLVADTGEWGTYAWAEMVLGVPGGRIAGGTDEIMRNIVGERVLGLPKEPPAAR